MKGGGVEKNLRYPAKATFRRPAGGGRTKKGAEQKGASRRRKMIIKQAVGKIRLRQSR